VLVKSKQGVSALCGVVSRFGDGFATSLKVSELALHTSIRVRCLEQTISGDGKELVLNYVNDALEIVTKGKFVTLLKLEMQQGADGRSSWTVALQEFKDLVDFNFDGHVGHVKQMKGVVKTSNFISHDAGKIRVIASNSEASWKSTENKFPCPYCSAAKLKELSKKQLQIHMSAHALSSGSIAYGAIQYPCSQCGQHETVQKVEKDDVASGCQISIKNDREAIIICKVVGEVKFKTLSMSKSSKSSPFTNIPIQCSQCEKVVSKYSLRKHWQAMHSNMMIPSDIRELIALKGEETDTTVIEHFLKSKGAVNKKRAAKEAGGAGGAVITTANNAAN
jgi:DNA-directed RNA polymerase beta' subunit